MFLDVLQLLQFENSDARVNILFVLAPVMSGAHNDVRAEGEERTTQKIKI